VDLNAVANGGRFAFSNNYADASGSLTFQTIFKDQPDSTPGTVYTAAIKVGYGTVYIDAIVNVVTPLSVTPGVITGTPTIGTAVAYTPGVASGGTSPYTYAFQWFEDGVAISGATSSTFVPTPAQKGKILSVQITATDANLSTASATATAGSATINAPFPTPVWNPTPANGLDTIPGGESGTYTGSGPISSTGCIEFSVAGGAYGQGPTAITSGQTLATRWVVSPACGGAASGTPLTGTITDGVYENTYNITVDRLPAAFTFTPITNASLNSVQTSNSVSITGINTVAYVTYGAASTGTVIQGSTDGGTTWIAIPATGTG
jgi:hypothetical protein